jgi:hypothetical protein
MFLDSSLLLVQLMSTPFLHWHSSQDLKQVQRVVTSFFLLTSTNCASVTARFLSVVCILRALSIVLADFGAL